MNALFALALLASPSQAGVVMSVEYAVAPAGPSAPVVPVSAPGGGQMTTSLLGGLDLSGSLPLLPAPIPGLAGPALQFVGPQDAAPVQPEAAPAQAASAQANAPQGRRPERTPALPARPVPGGMTLALSRDRAADVAAPESAQSSPGAGGALLDSKPEDSSSSGSRFFDQSREEGQGSLRLGPSGERLSSLVASTILDGGAFGPGLGLGAGRLAAPGRREAFGGGHLHALSDAREGETLRDAVASGPGALTPGSPSRAVPAYFSAAGPNGTLGPAAKTAPGAPALAVPRALALDLSGSGLVVRVRSALRAVIAPSARSAEGSPVISAASGPSTALLERGAMLEAFSVSRAYAESKVAFQPLSSEGPSVAGLLASPLEPVSGSAPSLWWAWLVLPLFFAALRALP